MTNQLTDKELDQLLADPEHRDNPLLPALQMLLARDREQRGRLERLLRISDCSYDMARSQTHDLLNKYDRQLRRLEKITRISDRYQRSMLELNEQLKQAALRDPLTGLANRRLLMERLSEELERYRRGREPFSLVMLDADNFKRINDAFGHDTGDRALCMMADAISRQLRGYDLCARWGGEEFMLLLPETGLELATHIVDRVMQAVRALRLEKDEQVQLSISAGLAIYRPDESVELTINRADAALIQAKQNGRNRLQVAPT
ncbi:biofilm regulation diguanylate cyclase SiaD [Oceanisphaera arctica]|uniref:diguanylate cyclase n=1 Tax=Oceanisphaera arctica TaxID=641510 RepID=A0A2P5TMG0_9GAMM|nr:biofilm regulation diguanylate cyclase SiaD [Oceanisphaera arctica]PPL16646.1 GGDEF domain-containing protein [Oceanisphaera arctica]GHA21124.1 GGDEF domain-containing protein [Oceanisphaera arctica]